MSVMDLRVLAERIPLVADRALVEIVNSTETAGHLADHRAGEGFFRRLWSKGTGADRKREVQGTQALARAQRLTVDLVRDLGEHLSFTNLNVALVSTRLDELARETEDSGLLARQSLGEVSELASVVASFMDITSRRLDAVEQRLDTHAALLDVHAAALLELERRQVHGELWQNSRDTVDALMRKWRTYGAYRSLPWPVQALLLARQLAAGKPGEHEAATGDREWRERLTDELLADPGYGELREALGWRERLPLAALLSHVLAGLPGADDRLMVAELLGAGLPPGLRPPHGPLALVTARTLELAVLRPQEQQAHLIHQARQDTFAECLTRPGAMTAQEFVRWAVEEQADAARAARGRVGRGLAPGGPGTLPEAVADAVPVPDPVGEGSV
ncbi:hypothetical protein [Streptomyces sp. NRRL F-5123]|uniref:hypothetical protein n=1 Tax=Streptomyces sp. NRRL F-5123 TaxID=1463856 RepID=UPI0004E13EE2|nr:hypothetical protein [Streptomyces sp. NRRL F-5123]